MPPLLITPELEKAEEKYEKQFGEDYPRERVPFGADADACIADIEQRIKGNDPWKEKDLLPVWIDN